LRKPSIELGPQHNPEGSLLYRCGGTLVLVAASVEEGVRSWMQGSGSGWVTAEYAMHPRANPDRQPRDGRRGRIDGRTQEIQRIIARALRSAVALDKLGERTITVDCDVLDADGGTRTASVTGGFVALALALDRLRRRGLVGEGVLREPVAAISVGIVGGTPMLDLCYTEDSAATVDLNVVGTANNGVVEVQGTAEGAPIPRERLDGLIDLAMGGMPQLVEAQKSALGQAGVDVSSLTG
jgi:ribonuclease PH